MKIKPKNPPHPGEVLRDRILKPLKLSGYALHKATGLQEMTVSRLLKGTVGVTPETAIRLARFTGVPAAYWLKLQNDFDLHRLLTEKGPQIYEAITPFPYTDENETIPDDLVLNPA